LTSTFNQVRAKSVREAAMKMISDVLRTHADAALAVLLSLYPWSGLSDVVRLQNILETLVKRSNAAV
jgi:hypothetical protein